MKKSKLSLANSLGLFVVSIPLVSFAQSTLEEITITAQKREQSLNDVGISVSAFGSGDIEEHRIGTMSELGGFIPNLKMSDSRPGGSPKIVVRGVGVNDFLVSSNPSTAVYFDGVYSPSLGTISGQFFDLERIEVLKGPQTTLYGRNSTAGSIQVIGRAPSDEFDAYLRAGYGNYETAELEGAVGGALSDSLSARISIKTLQRDEGYMTNTFPGGEEIGVLDRTDVRAKFLWKAAEDLEILTTVTYGSEDSIPGAWTSFGRRQPGGAQDVRPFPPFCAADIAGVHDEANCASVFGAQDIDGDPYTLSENTSWGVDSDDYSVSVNTTWDLEKFTLKSTTAYLNWDQTRHQSDGRPTSEGHVQRNQEISQFSQEVQLVSPGNEFIDWVIGGYFSKGETVIFRQNEPALFGGTVNTQDNEIITAQTYVQLDWNLSEQLQLISGLRYTWEKNSNVGATWADNNESLQIDEGDVRQAFIDDDISENEVSWKLGVNYYPNTDLLLYATVTKGFKSGGFFSGFAGSDEQLLPYDKETLLAYEGGFKATLSEGTLQLNGSVFYYDYKDIQTNTNEVVNSQLIVKFGNIPEATIMGAELEAAWVPLEGLDLRLGVGYLDTEVGEFLFGGNNTLFPEGNELPNAPHLSLSGTARYEWLLNSSFRLAVSGSVSSFDDTFQEVENVARTRIDTGATLVNARLELIPASSDQWNVALWSKNLTDEEYSVSSFQNASNVFALYNLPRTYGIEVNYRW